MNGDFSKGPVWKSILSQSAPLMLAHLVQLLYNIVDRIYIGHMENIGSIALTGIGLTFPIPTLIIALTQLYSSGGVPLFSISRGAKNEKRAEKLLGHVFSLLTATSVIVTAAIYFFKKPLLFLFGASDSTFFYADSYLSIYLAGTVFSMISTGMNGFITAQGFPRLSMLTTVIGAVINLVLDPVFIFALGMGVAGAALATVISQAVSAVWVLGFLFGKKNTYRIRIKNLVPEWKLVCEILSLGVSGFIASATNCAVQIVCNMTLKKYGGDLYVGVMTVISSVREILALPANSISSGSQPVLGYNYGAKKYARLRSGIKFSCITCAVYTAVAWIVIILTPRFLMSVFTDDMTMIEVGAGCLDTYFFGFVFMAFQFSGQSVFTALGCSKRAVLFSLLRKAVIVIPLTLILPQMYGLGVKGVFVAEPVSNVVGGLICFVTMMLSLYIRLPKQDE